MRKLMESDIAQIVKKVINEMEYNSDYYDVHTRDNDDDGYMTSYQYVLDTFINGQFSQLRKQLDEMDNISGLFRYLKNDGSDYATDLRDWINEHYYD